MNKIRILSFICLLLGISFFILGFFYDKVNAGIFIIFPFIYGSGIYFFIGFIFIFIVIIIFTMEFFNDFQREKIENYYNKSEPIKKKSVNAGGIILLGPIPLVFGTNWKITFLLMILSIIIILISFFLLKIF